ncbi:MAG TPA: response regulator transcription factor [Chloroflexota bacterium]|nr:response regulator transcription factor [Chloroflexota bacterium]
MNGSANGNSNGSARRILVVDDEPGILVYVGANLRAQGYEVATARNGQAALDAAALKPPDAVVLDLAMPGIDGYETLRRLREWTLAPVIVLSAHADEADKVRALDLGADDYLTKPFGVDELLARVRVALRRLDAYAAGAGGGVTGPVVDAGGPAALVIDLGRRLVLRDGEEVQLTRTEYELLAYLARNLGRVVGQRELLQRVWGPEYGSESDYLRTFVRQLRKKLEPDPANPVYLLTATGVGYRLRRP